MQDQERQEAERIVRRAEELGHDPGRVARALERRPPAALGRQAIVSVEQRTRFAGALQRLRGRP